MERMWAFAHMPREQAEALLFVHYDDSGFYGLHNDTHSNFPGQITDDQRLVTLLLYLQEPDGGRDGGGHTIIPLADAPDSLMRTTKLPWVVPDPHNPNRKDLHRSKVRACTPWYSIES